MFASVPPFPVRARQPLARCLAAPSAAQLQRFEFKYLVSEATARGISQFVRCYLTPDEFAARSADHSYAVHSLYLDSPDLALFAATNGGDTNRFKLRIRYYDEAPDSPVFFELKSRRNECVSKLRAGVRRDAVPRLLAGEWPTVHHLTRNDARQLFALQEFCRRMRQLGATPRSHVAYQREAWMSRGDNSLRITFDRQVQCEPQFSSGLHASVGAGTVVEPFESRVICEIKFTNRFPNWCGELVRVFGLVRGGAAKYAEGVTRMGEHRLSNGDVGLLRPVSSPVRDEELLLQGQTIHPF